MILYLYKLFWSCPSRFERVQIILVGFKLDFPGPNQNELDLSKTIGKYSTKIIWLVQNHFGDEKQSIGEKIECHFLENNHRDILIIDFVILLTGCLIVKYIK